MVSPGFFGALSVLFDFGLDLVKAALDIVETPLAAFFRGDLLPPDFLEAGDEAEAAAAAGFAPDSFASGVCALAQVRAAAIS